MIPAYWGQISNRTADPMAFLDVQGYDAHRVSLPGDDSLCPLTAGREGSRENPQGGRNLMGRLWLASGYFHQKACFTIRYSHVP